MSRGEWFMSSRISSYRHLASELALRLHRAVGACGYSNEAGAAAYVGEECMAIASRITDGWQAICASPDEASLRRVALKLAYHLWAVKTDGVAPLAPQDRQRRAAEESARQGFIGGKELMLTLACAVGNDADLVPLVEAREVRADKGTATKIAQEMYQQWTNARLMPKSTFRRVLARRLQEAGSRLRPIPRYSASPPQSAAR